MTDDDARENGNIYRTLGRLEESGKNLNKNVDSLIRKQDSSDRASAQYRKEMRQTVDEINDKVDPLTTRLDALELTVKAHDVILKADAEREIELRGAARLGRWLIHAFWLFGSLVAIFYSDKIKFPIQKLLALFK